MDDINKAKKRRKKRNIIDLTQSDDENENKQNIKRRKISFKRESNEDNIIITIE